MLWRRIGVGLSNATFRRIIENVMGRVRGLRIAIARHFPPMRQNALPNQQIVVPHEQNPPQQNAPQHPTPPQNVQQHTPPQNAPGTSSNTKSTALYSEKGRSKRAENPSKNTKNSKSKKGDKKNK